MSTQEPYGDRRWVTCAYCGVLLARPDDHPMVYETRKLPLQRRQRHPVIDATVLVRHVLIDLVVWGRMHRDTCAVWAQRNPRWGGAIGPVAGMAS